MRLNIFSFEGRRVRSTCNIDDGGVDIDDVRRVVKHCSRVFYAFRPTHDEWRRNAAFMRVVLEQPEWSVVDVRPCDINACERVRWSRFNVRAITSPDHPTINGRVVVSRWVWGRAIFCQQFGAPAVICKEHYYGVVEFT